MPAICSEGTSDLVRLGSAKSYAAVDLNGVLEARKYYDEALALNPRLVPAIVGKGFSLQAEFFFDTSSKQRIAMEMDELSTRAFLLDPMETNTWALRAFALAWQGRWGEALAANEKARSLMPYDPSLVTDQAILTWLSGKAEDAESLQLAAMAMDPPGGPSEFRHLCIVQLLLGRYQEAAAACEKAGGLDEWYEDKLWLVAAYAQSGDMAKAAATRVALARRAPALTIENSLIHHMSDQPGYVERLQQHVYPGLRKAGIPDK